MGSHETNNYFKVGRLAFLFFDDRNRGSIAEALRQACLVQDLAIAGDRRICIFRRNRHSDMYQDLPEVGEVIEPSPALVDAVDASAGPEKETLAAESVAVAEKAASLS